MRTSVLGLAGCLIAVSLPFVTQIEGGSTALKSLPGVAVIGETTSPELRPYGVDDDWLEERASTVLDRRRVPLLTRADAISADRQPLLVVRLQTIRLPNTRTFAWHLSVAVHQKMITHGTPPDTVLSQTWAATGALGVTNGHLLKNSVGETLDDKLGEFAQAWHSERR